MNSLDRLKATWEQVAKFADASGERCICDDCIHAYAGFLIADLEVMLGGTV